MAALEGMERSLRAPARMKEKICRKEKGCRGEGAGGTIQTYGKRVRKKVRNATRVCKHRARPRRGKGIGKKNCGENVGNLHEPVTSTIARKIVHGRKPMGGRKIEIRAAQGTVDFRRISQSASCGESTCEGTNTGHV